MVSPSAQPPSRYRRRILGVGALLTGALYVIGAPIYNGRIEADLDRRVPAELEDAGYDGVKASFSGQDGTLTCRAPLDDPERARAAAYEVWGVHAIELDRSCRVNTVSTAAVDDTTPGEASDEATATGSVDESRESIPTTVPPPPTTVESDLATVNDIVAANPDLAFLAVLLSDADIGRTGDPVTLFAPSNAAFDAMPADVLGRLQNDSELLERSLSHHAVDGIIRSGDLVEGELTALDGTTLAVEVGETISVGGATIVDADIVASNGVVHVVDRVILVPETVDDEEPGQAAATFDGERIVLAGVVASEAERQILVESAVGAVGEDFVVDDLTADPDTGLDSERSEAMATLILAAPASLVSVEVGFDGTRLYANGVAVSEEAGQTFVVVASSVGVDAVLTEPPDATAADADDLEDQLNAFVVENPILFQPSSAVLDQSAFEVLDRLTQLAQRFTGVAITVEGHTDSDGAANENLQLSQNRAEAVQAALVERSLTDVEAVGFGSERPVLVDGVEDKTASRRVEFRVVTIS